MIDERADRATRFVAGIIAIVGTLLLAFAVRELHQRVFAHKEGIRRTLRKARESGTEVAIEDILSGQQDYPREHIMTNIAIGFLIVAAVMVLVADIINLADPDEDPDDPE